MSALSTPINTDYEDLPEWLWASSSVYAFMRESSGMKKKSYWGFKFPRPSAASLPLDEVKVAGSLNLRLVKDAWKRGDATPWMKQLLEALETDDTKVETWCGSTKESQEEVMAMRDPRTHKDYKAQLDDLVQWKVMYVPSETGEASTFAFFTVPKSDGETARTICDCKLLGKLFGDPPKMRLVTPAELFSIMGRFRKPHTVTLDFRHWFHQILLPDKAQRFFTTYCEGLGTDYGFGPWASRGHRRLRKALA